MPDRRSHRGAHPEDAALFAAANVPRLRDAVGDVSWLLTRGYAEPSALKVVGDRYALDARQRTAVMRCACSDDALARRRARLEPVGALRGGQVLLDGYNVLLTVEAALGGGVILGARDGCFRDLASVHGTYRSVEETRPALRLIGRTLAEAAPATCTWYLDSPISNSGRLRQTMEHVARERGWAWNVQLVPDPDRVLSAAGDDAVVASADSVILDACARWTNLARAVVARHVLGAFVAKLGAGDA
jgi:hypothetical protein